MKKKKDKIDALLQSNTTEQLADVDWDDLNAAISGQLDKAQQIKTSATGFPTVFRIAAVTAAAAILIIVMVSFTDEKGSATVAIINPSDRAHVQVNIVEMDSYRGKCDVQIIDSSTARKQEDKIRPNWFVISKTESASMKNGLDRDMRDIACLF
jgi:anti-sigma-K factor RskA